MPRLKKKTPAMVTAKDRRRKNFSKKCESEKEKIRQVNSRSQRIRRENNQVRVDMNLLNSLFQKKRLAVTENREKHRVLNREAQQNRLSNPERRKDQIAAAKVIQSRKLADPVKRDQHRNLLREAQNTRLSDPEKRKAHVAAAKVIQARRLADPEKRDQHRNLLREAQNTRLSDPEKRKAHVAAAKVIQARRLADPEKRDQHRNLLREAQNTRLSDPEKRKAHVAAAKVVQSRRLADPQKLDQHRNLLRGAQNNRLSDPEKRKAHVAAAKVVQSRRLADPQKLDQHRNLLREAQNTRLSDPEKRKAHVAAAKVVQSRRLADPEKRDQHRNLLREAQNTRLSDPEKRKAHKELLKVTQKTRLSNPEKRKAHVAAAKVVQSRRLADPEKRDQHRKLLRAAQNTRLADPEKRKAHVAAAKVLQSKRLADPEKRDQHKSLLREAQDTRLSDPEKRKAHVAAAKVVQSRRLADPEKRDQHRKLLRAAQNTRLADPKKRKGHKERLKVAQKNRLADYGKLQIHRSRLINAQKKRLSNPIKLRKHNKVNSRCQRLRWRKHLQTFSGHRYRIKLQGSSSIQNNKYRGIKRRASHLRWKYFKANKIEISRSKLLSKYRDIIKRGPEFTCACCGRLCFEQSIKFFGGDKTSKRLSPTDSFREKFCNREVTEGFGVDGVCGTCDSYLRQLRVPPLSLAAHEDLRFPKVPISVKNLTSLEERFVSPRIPFMQIRASNVDQQFSIHGRVVNVPCNVINSVKILPRVFNETAVIPIALKKKKSFKSVVQEEPIRPHAIAEALMDLANCPAFQEAEVFVDSKRIPILSCRGMFVDDKVDGNCKDKEKSAEDSEFEEDDPEPANVPIESTLLISNINPDALVFTPGEGFSPLPLFLDIHAEALSFIRIYGGQLRPKPNHLSYQKLVNSELLRYDRRCASEPSKLFYCATKLRGMKISASILLCLKKLKGKQQKPTAGYCLSEDLIKSFHIHDSGYRLILPDRGSPAFWAQKQSEVFAMIRQLGPPTLFLTLSPAETQWPELLVLLKKVVDNEIITGCMASALSYRDKVRLISSDPVTCARYFDFRIKQMIKLFSTRDHGIFYEHEVLDYYYRVEFQQRGSPHIHSLLWLRNAPRLEDGNEDNVTLCEKFIDKFISCSSDKLSDDILAFQTHKHTFSCKKKNNKTKKSYCRFGIPFFPMKDTIILAPLAKDEVNDKKKKELNQNLTKIKDYLEEIYKDIGKKCPVTENSVQAFLNHLNLSNEDYVLSIRNSLKRPTVFLKRLPNDVRTNAYNYDILNLHRANMDIQFITDTYSVAVYVLNYINKTKRGISKVLRDANDEVAKGDLSIKEKLKFMANKFLDSSEFSAQEAVYYVLPLPLSQCTRSVEFINTGPPEKRVHILLPKKELQRLSVDSTEVFAKSNIDHYVNRPDVLSDLCLADFVAWYNYKKSRTSSERSKSPTKFDNSDIDHENYEPPKVLQLKHNDGYISKRTKSKIIRFVRFNVETQEEDFYREQLMLFLPWIDEESELICVDHKEKFSKNKQVIVRHRKPFIFRSSNEEGNDDFIDEAIREHNKNDTFSREEDESIGDVNHEDGYEVLRDRTDEGDVLYDGGFIIGNDKNEDEFVPVPHVLPEERYLEVVRSLNEKQQRYHLHVLHSIKTNAAPIYECVLGSAGVGKSRLIEALEQSVIRFYNSTAGVQLDALRVLLCAPTGKAAFNIRGVTLHSVFVLPLNQASYDMPPLSSSVSNGLFCKLKNVKLIIMDEVSMIGTKMFARVDARLKQIFRSNLPFAGISVILFGDFNQLAPVGDGYIFSQNSANPYSNLIGNPLWELFRFYKLTEIMRQKDDAPFATALNNLAMGCLTSNEIEMFESRIRTNCTPSSKALRLFRTNEEVDTFNRSVFSRKNASEILQFDAIDRVMGKVSESQRSSTLEYMKKTTKTANTYGLPTHIKLCLGIRYMVTVNVKTPDGLVNGAVGTLQYIETLDNDKVVRLWLLFDDEKVGRETRRGTRAATQHLGIDQKLTPLDLVSRNIKPRQNSPIMVMRKQFPVVPAEAITIYKSQGGTYDSVVVTLRKGMRRNEMYVAFSRSTSLKGLTILGNFKPPGPIDKNNVVVKEIEKGLSEKPVEMTLHFLQDHPELFSIIFHNVNSLRKHLPDISKDECFKSAKLMIIVETWLKSSEFVDLPGYTVVYRSDVKKSQAHAYGIMIFSKIDTANQIQLVYDFNVEKKGFASNIAVVRNRNTFICGVYKPPSTPMRILIPRLEEAVSIILTQNPETILILGDFNEDLMKDEQTQLKNFFESKGLFNLLQREPSTNLLTQIDLCFSNNTEFLASYYESYFSYHKPIVCIQGLTKYPVGMELQNCDKGESSQAIESSQTTLDKGRLSNGLPGIRQREEEMFEESITVIEDDMPTVDDHERYRLARINLLKEIEGNVLPADSWLSDRPLDEVLKIIRTTKEIGTIDCIMLQCIESVEPAPTDRDILILGGLHTINHWHCTYYDGSKLKIYDSLYSNLPNEERLLIEKRYPNLTKDDITFERCQQQPDSNSCGVFAAANAVSLALGLNPSELKYKLDSQLSSNTLSTVTMRRHLMKIIGENRLIPFETSI